MKSGVFGFVLGISVMFGAAAFAQAQAPKAAAAAPAKQESYSELESLMVQYVQANDQLAACRQQLGQKGVLDLGASVKDRVEAAHPGYTVDWKTGALVPKQPQK
jgi:hypothetical protein